MPRFATSDPVVVIGLGKFGTAVAEELVARGKEVLAVERDPGLVQSVADRVTLAVEADARDTEVLRQLGVDEFRHAIVAIGSDLEASVMVTSALSQLGVPEIWSKAMSAAQGRVLERVGATRVLYPEAERGRQVAEEIMTLPRD